MHNIVRALVGPDRGGGSAHDQRLLDLFAELGRDFERLTGAGWWCVDIATGELIWSRGTFRLHGYDPRRPVTVAEALDFYDVSERARIAELIEQSIANRAGFTFDSTIITAKGLPRRVRSNGMIKQVDGREFLIGTIQNISDFHDESLTAKWVSWRDVLTTLPNRRALYALGELALDAGDGALALLDVDNLKAINDVFGHDAGDRVIAAIGQALRDTFPLGCVARVGGDEFCVLVEGCTAETMIDDFRRFSERLRSAAIPKASYIALGGSVGITPYKRGDKLQTVLKQADRAAYFSKNCRRGGVTVYTDELREAAVSRDHAVSSVRRALERSRLATYFQPIADMGSGEVIGFEALTRCEAPSGRPLKVDLATAFADSNLSRAVLPRVVAEACAFSAAVGRPVNVNATFFDVVGTDFFDLLEANRRAHGLNRSDIAIEVTETAILSDRSNIFLKRLIELADAGYPIALDDFGTGFSSLTHLRELKVDKVKIDKSFVKMIDDRRDRLLVKGVIDLCHSMGVGIIAEGVETHEQAVALARLGCMQMQGHLFGRAQPAREYLGDGPQAVPPLAAAG